MWFKPVLQHLCFQDCSCIPTTVNYTCAVVLNASEQSLFWHGLIRSLSLSSVITLVGIAYLVLCAAQLLACSSPHPYTTLRISPWIWKSRLYFKCWCLNYWKIQGENPGGYCFHELYAYQWKLRKKEVWHVAAVTLWQTSCTSASGLFALKRFKYDSSNWKAFLLPYAEIHHGSFCCWPVGQIKIFCNCCFEEQVKCWQAFSSDMFLLWISFNFLWLN